METSYQLKLYPDSLLREKALPVAQINGEVHHLVKAMSEIMYSYQGIGLAAPQVGILKQIVIMDIGDGLLPLINPQILEQSGDDRLEEGCLSFPNIQVNIRRNQTIYVNGLDLNGNEIGKEVSGLMARVIQHEIDHLNGVLIIDYASVIEKYVLRSKLKEMEEFTRNLNKNII